MANQILLINGPNLNLLGTREPHLYGSKTLPEVEADARAQCAQVKAEIETFQSNWEGAEAIIDKIHEARGKVDAIIINPGALTHTSVALRDALLSVDIPFIELHVTNVHARESWRHHSYLSDKAQAVICGMGTFGYEAAITHVTRNWKKLAT